MPARPADRPPGRDLTNAYILLLGTRYDAPGSRLRDEPAVTGTLAALRQRFIDRCGAPAHDVRVVSDLPTTTVLGDALREAAGQHERDVLVIYYVGHGLVSQDGHLFLTTKNSDGDPTRVKHTALDYGVLREYARDSRASCVLVVLDCCFSGRAVGFLGAADEAGQLANLAAIDGGYVLASAGPEEVALAPPGQAHTAFSGALIDLLDHGDPRCGPHLTLRDTHHHLLRVAQSRGLPRPQRRGTGTVDDLVLADNAAWPVRADSTVPARPPPRRPRVLSTWLAAAAGTALAPWLVAGAREGRWGRWPGGVSGWVLQQRWTLALLAAVSVVATAAVLWLGRLTARRSVARSSARRRSMVAAVLAAVLAAGLGAGAVAAAAAIRVWQAGCPLAVQLRVLTPADGYESGLRLGDAFERYTALRNHGCPSARVFVLTAATDEVVEAIENGWGEAEQIAIGPRPQVWLADSLVGARLVTAARPALVAEDRSVAVSPLVLAVPAADIGELAGRTSQDLATLFATLSDPDLGWRMAAPHLDSTAGELARVGLYHEASEAIPPRRVERLLDLSLDGERYPVDVDTATLLCRRPMPERTGFVIPEQALARFNRGDPLGPACGARSAGRPELLAIYPARTPVLDYRFVRFGWPELAAVQVDAATAFGAWLATGSGRRALLDVGLRPPGYGSLDSAPVSPLTDEFGILPRAQFDPLPADIDTLAEVRASYHLARRPGRVLLALDASGSMRALTVDGRRRWDVAVNGIRRALDLMGVRDEVGAWVFHGDAASGVRRLIPIGGRDSSAGGPGRREAVVAALGTVRVGGATPLLAAIVAGVHAVGSTTEDRLTALVVLTDGEDTASSLTADQFRAAVAGGGARVIVVAVGEARCNARALRIVTESTGGDCVEASFATVGHVLASVVESLWQTDGRPA